MNFTPSNWKLENQICRSLLEKIVLPRPLWNPEVPYDRLCGLVVRVSGYKSRGPEFDSQPYQIF
jgi:hypothetical protein